MTTDNFFVSLDPLGLVKGSPNMETKGTFSMPLQDSYEQTDWLGDIAREQTSPPDWNGVRSFLTHKPAVENSTDAVIKDLKDREAMGLKKYGEYVHESKDNMLQHLYEELLDAAIYIKTEINRRKGT